MKNTQGANLRIAVLLPLLAITALILWAAADVAREAAALRRLGQAEAAAKAEALAAKIHEARNIGLLADSLAGLAHNAEGVLLSGGAVLAEQVRAEHTLLLVDGQGQAIGGLGALPAPADLPGLLQQSQLAATQGRDWIGAPYPCLAATSPTTPQLCASLVHGLEYNPVPGQVPGQAPGAATRDWAVISFLLPADMEQLPGSGAALRWLRLGGVGDSRTPQPWLGETQPRSLVWFEQRLPLLGDVGLMLQVHQPPQNWAWLWWQHNGQRFLLLAAAVLACFGLAGLLAARLLRSLREHRRTQEELAARESQVRAVFDLVPDGFIVQDLGRVIFANPGAVRMLRAENLADLVGRDIFQILTPENRAVALARTRRIQEDGIMPDPARMAAQRLDGSPLTLQVQGRPILFDGRQVTLSVLYDITDQTRVQAEVAHARNVAEAASRAKSEFLAHMSHELRTPLNSIIGFAELLDRQHLGPLGATKYQEYVRDILDSGRHLLTLINGVLDLSRAEAGKLVPHDEEIDLLALARVCLRSIAELAESRGICLIDRLDIGPEPPLLNADARMTRQVILNLLSNALKFTQPGGEITVSIARSDEDGLTLTVQDNGIGIAADDLERVFEPFVQADGSHRRRFEGSGLGLPLSRRLMEAHGGTLTLESAPGQGTVARMSFPAARVVDMPAQI